MKTIPLLALPESRRVKPLRLPGGHGLIAVVGVLVVVMSPVSSFADKWAPDGPGVDGRQLNRVWMSGSAGWAVGTDGVIRHTTDGGATWGWQNSGTTVTLRGVWGADPAHVWAVGDFGTIVFYDGNAWTAQTSGTALSLQGLWGNDANNVWAVGAGGTILKWNGSMWSAQSSGTAEGLNAVSGYDLNNVWAVGDNGTIRKWNGSTWNGSTWSGQTSGSGNALMGVFAGDNLNTYAVGGGTILRCEAGTWSALSPVPAGNYLDVWGMYANSTWNVWAVGASGLVAKTQGGAWVVETSSTTKQLNGVGGIYDNKVCAVGNDGTVIRREGTPDFSIVWTLQAFGVSSMVNSIWGTDASNVWAVAGGGATNVGYILRKNGVNWTVDTVTLPTAQYFPNFGIWVADPSNIWLVGGGGSVLKWDGGTWNSQASGTTNSLYAVWGLSTSSVWAVGAGGVIRFWNGTSWSAQNSTTNRDLYGIWGADGNNVWAVGAEGVIVKWNGSDWSTVQVPTTTHTLTAVHGTSAANVWAVGSFGRIQRWNGSSWVVQFPPMDSNLNGVWAADASNVWAVGDTRNQTSGTAVIWKSTNGGASWLRDTTSTGAYHQAIWGTNPDYLYVASHYGQILSNVAPEIGVEQPSGTPLADGGSTVDFGTGSVAYPTSLSYTIRNTGLADLIVSTITFDGANAADFAITSAPTSPVVPGGSTTFTVAFTPGAVGPRSAAMHIPSNDSNESPFDISLTGTGVTPEIGVEQPAGTNLTDGSSVVAFGSTAPGTPVVKTFTVRNTGGGDLTGLTVTKDGASAADFTVGAITASVAPGGSTTFDVTFNPAMPGDKAAAIHIANNDLDENPFDIMLTGTGSGGTLATYKEGANDPFTGTAYAGTEDLWLYNNGGTNGVNDNTGGDLRVIAGGIGGTAYRHELMRFNVSSLAGRFASINSVTLRLYFNGANANAGVIQVFAVAPANAGWVEGSGGTAVSGVSCWSRRVYPSTNWAGSQGASTPNTDYVDMVLASAPYAAAATGQSFDLVLPDASIINTWLGGTNAGLYLRTVLQNNQVIFHSSESTVALRPELIINYNPAFPEIALHDGATTGAPQLADGQVAVVDFGYTAQGTAVTRDFTIANTGTAALTVSSIIGPSGCTVLNAPGAAIAPAATHTFQVRLDAASVGAFNGSVTVNSNDADEAAFDFPISGIVQNAPFHNWAAGSGLSGADLAPTANPAGDDVENLLKYAFNMNPTTVDVSELTPGTGTSGLPTYDTTGSGASSFFRYEFIRRIGGGLVYTPKKSPNLLTWLNLTSTPTVTPIDANWERVVHLEPFDGTVIEELFGLVEVALP